MFTNKIKYIYLFAFLAAAIFVLNGSAFFGLKIKIAEAAMLYGVSDYLVYSDDYCHIYYKIEDKENVRLIAGSVSLYFPMLKQSFDITESLKPSIILRQSSEAMIKGVRVKSGAAPLGAYYGGVINILTPRAWAGDNQADIIDNFLKDGPVVHELTHYILDHKTRGNYEIWFTEGVALYYEYKYLGVTWREDLDGAAAGYSFSDMNKAFKRLDNALAYRRAFEIINGIVTEKGEDELQKMIGDLSLAR